MDIEVIQAIERVRRAMQRNADVMLICDELEKVAHAVAAPVKRKFDKRTYQRELMRRRRAAGKMA